MNSNTTIKRKVYAAIFSLGSKIFGGTSYRKLPLLRKIRDHIAKRSRASLIETRDGIKLYKDPVLGLMDEGGVFEEGTTDAVVSNINKGDVVVNIGANVGYYTCIAAKHVGSTGRVHAFEPDPFSRKLLRKNINENNLENIEVYPYAIADKKGMAQFYVNGPFSTLNFDRFKDGGEVIEVETITLDELFGDKRIDMVIIDAEGSEPKIVRGMKNILEKNPDIKIIMEFSITLIEAAGESPHKFLELLAVRGFSFYALDDVGATAPVKSTVEDLFRLCAETKTDNDTINMFCVRE